MSVVTLAWNDRGKGSVRLIDQTRLPTELVELEIDSVDGMVDAIRRLAVRGAPAIGVAAAFGVVLGVIRHADQTPADVLGRAQEAAATLAKARPTAVNLFWALDRVIQRATREFQARRTGREIADALLDEAQQMYKEDQDTCRRIGAYGAELLRHGQTVLTHCNAGSLATVDYGTALAPIYTAKEQGKRIAVYADETRPLLQGSRLTAWELARRGVEVTLITDNMAGRVMFEGKIDAVFVGADRIARNGDVCNKIGTYSVAVLAREHGIPFYVCAPLSTFDAKIEHGGMIPIEERQADEITDGLGRRTAPPGQKVYNPAFDVTPARLVTAIVTERGVVERPNTTKIDALLAQGAKAART